MKILAINVLYYPLVGGGAEVIMQGLCEGLKSRGHDVYVLTFTEKNSSEEEIDGIKIYREKIPNLYLPYFHNRDKPSSLIRRLWHILDIYNPISGKIAETYIEKLKPDIIISHNIPGWSPSIWQAAADKSIPLIQVLHDQYLLCPTSMFKNNRICETRCKICSIMRYPHKILSSKVTAVVGVSNFLLKKLLSYEYFKDTPIKKVIYNSRNLTTADTKPREYDGNLHFGFIGSLAPNKGIEMLLRAYLKIKSSNFKLFVAGSGDNNYVNYLKTQFRDESIIWMGWVKPDGFFSKVDVTIVPSMWEEPLSMVVIESFAHGIPVIGSKIGGIPELITENENGLLFGPGNYNELSVKMREFSKNINRWKGNHKEIQKSAEKFLNYEAWISMWEKLLDEVKCIRKKG